MLFFTALAAMMLVDFFPMPWKGQVGLLKNNSPAAGGVVAGVVLVTNLAYLCPWIVIYAVILGLFYGVRHKFMREVPGGNAGARDAIKRLILSAAVAFVLLIVLLPERNWFSARAVGAFGDLGSFLSSSRVLRYLLTRLPAASAWAAGYLFSLGFGGLIIGALLAGLQREISHERVKSESSEEAEKVEEGIRHAGRLIGFFEAFIITTLVAMNQWSAISFLVAAKAVGRIKQMEERPFAEYFLVGTLANVSIAIIGGMIIRAA